MFAMMLAAALLASQPADAPPSGEPALPLVSETWREAASNRARIKVAPSFVDGPRAELPEAERSLGHHGPVVVEGIIGIDGRMTEARVKRSSKAPGVDTIALNAALASTFTPAKDANGTPVPVIVAMPFDLVAYKSSEAMGILQYRCEQFVRDMDWWKSVNPDKPYKDHELYQLESGMEFAADVLQANGNDAQTKGISADFDRRWEAAIAYCRKKPKILQRDAIFR